MTCIVGQVDQKRGCVFVGGDCAGTVDPKAFRVGDYLFGCVGDIRMMQLLHYSLELPPCPETVDLARYLASDFITAVRTCFRDGGYAKKRDEREQGGTFLVGTKNGGISHTSKRTRQGNFAHVKHDEKPLLTTLLRCRVP